MTGEAWEQITVPKPRASHLPTLGQDAISAKTGKPKRIPRAELARGAEASRHATCIVHVVIGGGLSEPVCIRRGDDREAVLAAARELSGAEPTP